MENTSLNRYVDRFSLCEFEHFLFLISQTDHFVDYGFVLVFSHEEVLLQQSRRWLF